ncbi:putative leader peptide [Streptomyces sp. NPDC038707]|uniref:putative leader peptide n=1 Tax=Streptomyces sp. NPDC038707 TaxID=3154329 RepID=UPI0033EE2201
MIPGALRCSRAPAAAPAAGPLRSRLTDSVLTGPAASWHRPVIMRPATEPAHARIALVARRHVDLCRQSSALCR